MSERADKTELRRQFTEKLGYELALSQAQRVSDNKITVELLELCAKCAVAFTKKLDELLPGGETP